MAQDIEEFLRMAAARKKQQAQGAQQPPSQNPTPAPTPPPAPTTGHQSWNNPTSSLSEPDIYIGDDSTSDQVPNLKSQVRSSVSTADFAENASHLGENVYQRDDMTDDRVHQRFDHDLGRLQKEDIEVAEVIDHGTGEETHLDISEVLKLIRNPNTLKQAIILKEIFERPKF